MLYSKIHINSSLFTKLNEPFILINWIYLILAILYRNHENVIIKVVKDIPNPYALNSKFEKRFIFTLNKIYAWTLMEYERVVMLDVDNVFLRAPDELFQCGEFCAVFINPCIFHTGLFVLKVEFFSFSKCNLDNMT